MQTLINLGILGAVFLFVVLPLVGAAVRIVQEYERGVIFRLGRLVGPRGPGSSSSSRSSIEW
jgi:regulator of protease activity HflC (stomatin/prohibitin superfamily)